MKHHCINNNPKLVQQLFFQYNLRKLVPEWHHNGLHWGKADGSGDNWSYKTCKAPIKSPLPTYQTQRLTGWILPGLLPYSIKALKRESITFHGLTPSSHLGSSILVVIIKSWTGYLGDGCQASYQAAYNSTPIIIALTELHWQSWCYFLTTIKVNIILWTGLIHNDWSGSGKTIHGHHGCPDTFAHSMSPSFHFAALTSTCTSEYFS